MLHRFFDLVLDFPVRLPELQPVTARPADLRVEFAPPRALEPCTSWFHHWYADGDPVLPVSSVAREPGGFRLRYPRLADFRISAALDRIRCEPAPGVPDHTLRHLLLDSVLPHVVGQRGELILHASAVRSPQGRGLAFVGKSGWGKSTLASAFHGRGYTLVGDDCLKLELRGQRLFGLPSYPGARLLPDSRERLFPGGRAIGPVAHYSSKQRLEMPTRGLEAPVEIHELYLLAEPAAEDADRLAPVRLAPRSGAAVVAALIASTFLLDIEDKRVVSRLFRAACVVAASASRCWSLAYRRDYQVLDAVLDAAADPEAALSEPPGG